MNSPCTGRPGFGSQVSRWLMPPLFQNRMTCSAGPGRWERRARSWLIGMPSMVALNIFSMRRRVRW